MFCLGLLTSLRSYTPLALVAFFLFKYPALPRQLLFFSEILRRTLSNRRLRIHEVINT